jgi:hydrogenase nickel incorporation protein HypB
MKVNVVQKVMKVNDEIATAVRDDLVAAGVSTFNVMSAPGSGKTTLIEATIDRIKDGLQIGVIEGDPETSIDAERIAQHGVPVTQIETAGGCHLEANLVQRALTNFDLAALQILIIENVGNLVCPVGFDLGEKRRVAVVSTTEGHDKPAKYPSLFRKADVVILNKCDLLPYVDFDVQTFHDYVRQLNPDAPIFELSCKTGEGLAPWVEWMVKETLQATTQVV